MCGTTCYSSVEAEEAEHAVLKLSFTYPSQGMGFCLGLVLLLVITLPLSSMPVVCAGTKSPVARIVDVQSPSHIRPGEDFSVTVAVEYSDAHSTDIAIIDAATGFVLASKDLFTPMPAGTTVFTFHLSGPNQPGVWELLTTVRTWWYNGWYSNQNGGTFRFNIEVVRPTTGTLSIRSNLPSAVVTVDNDLYKVPQEGLYLQTERGLHTIAAKSPLVLDNGTRTVFDHWSDGVHSSQRQMYVADRLDLSAVYVTEFYLLVRSNLGETLGSGWYVAGTNATFAVLRLGSTTRSPTDSGVDYEFSHWSGDSESTSSVSWVMMDRPKTVSANWSEDASARSKSQIVSISLVFLLCSGILAAIGVILRRLSAVKSHDGFPRSGRALRKLMPMLVLLMMIVGSSTVQDTYASNPFQPESIAIGDAVWYRWSVAASDTCLLWLGGGIAEHSSLTVNPYEYESYNTVRFIQDLANYYDVLALKKGTVSSVDTTLNRTMFVEPYPGRTNFIKSIRAWAKIQGYAHLYIVGYSVGALAAAKELVLANPEDWASPDGLVLITPQIPQDVSTKASTLRASLLVLYGEGMPEEFISSGERFFQNAPEDGWRGAFWYHKEYHVISDVQHEVWTNWESGDYDGRAALLTTKFIETSKSLQFENEKEHISRIATNLTNDTESTGQVNIHMRYIVSPDRVRAGQAFKTTTNLQFKLSSNFTIAVVAFDIGKGSIESVSIKRLYGNGEAQFTNIILANGTSSRLHFALISLIRLEDGWVLLKDGVKRFLTEVTDSVTLTVVLGYPSREVELDGNRYLTGADGRFTANVTRGEHTISVPPVIELGNTSRAVFLQWNETISSPTLTLRLSGDASLLAIYLRQYYLSVRSLFGHTTGTGWHDENEIVTFQVTPPVVLDERTHFFAGWSGDSSDPSPASRIHMNGPKSISALWEDAGSGDQNDSVFQQQIFLALTCAMLVASVVFVGGSFQLYRRQPQRRKSIPRKSQQNVVLTAWLLPDHVGSISCRCPRTVTKRTAS